MSGDKSTNMNAKDRAKSAWGKTPAGNIFARSMSPGTQEYFEMTMAKRNKYEIPWLFELVPFAQLNGKRVLEVGCGAGYDAYEFCRIGADYKGIDITPENIERTRKHLDFYGYVPDVMEGDAENLPFDDNYFDVIYSNGVLHHTSDIAKSFREAYRVLKPYGSAWIILYYKHSIFYWLKLVMTDQVLKLGFLRRSLSERLSMVEYSTGSEHPLVNVYGKRELKRLLQNAGFTVESLWIRKLVREDLPDLCIISRLWSCVPQKWLDFLGNYFGWYVIVKAGKSGELKQGRV